MKKKKSNFSHNKYSLQTIFKEKTEKSIKIFLIGIQLEFKKINFIENVLTLLK
jgi:hypothetical protein